MSENILIFMFLGKRRHGNVLSSRATIRGMMWRPGYQMMKHTLFTIILQISYVTFP